MRYFLIAVSAIGACGLCGCSPSSPADDGTMKPGSGVSLNPSGKPKTAAESTYAAQMQKTGAAMNAQMQKDAAAMAAAKARSQGR